MADLTQLTIRDLLPDRSKHMDDIVGAAIRDDRALKDAHFPKAITGVVAGKVKEAVADELNINVLTLLVGAWSKAREIEGYSMRASRHPAQEATTLFLGEHELNVVLHPLAMLKFGAISEFRLDFTVTLSAMLKVAQLTIRGGHILEVGRCEGSAGVQMSYGVLPLSKKLATHPIALARSFVIAPPGFKIP